MSPSGRPDGQAEATARPVPIGLPPASQQLLWSEDTWGNSGGATIVDKDGYVCGTCGVFHEGLPTSYGAEAPFHWFLIPEAERASRVHLEQDICTLDERDFFVKGNLEIHIHGRNDPFVWTVWTSLSRENFKRLLDHWDDPGREKEPPYFGWLCTLLPTYPDTLNLKTRVHTRSVGLRPFVELEPTDHPLAVEQREGISLERVAAIAEAILHGTTTPSG